VQKLLAERGITVDHVSIFRWMQRFTPLLAQAARPCRHRVGDRWWIDETYVNVSSQRRYIYRAIDQFGSLGRVGGQVQGAASGGGGQLSGDGEQAQPESFGFLPLCVVPASRE
jgi:hypothetical protein